MLLLLRKGCVTHPVIKRRWITGQLQKGHSVPEQTAHGNKEVIQVKAKHQSAQFEYRTKQLARTL